MAFFQAILGKGGYFWKSFSRKKIVLLLVEFVAILGLFVKVAFIGGYLAILLLFQAIIATFSKFFSIFFNFFQFFSIFFNFFPIYNFFQFKNKISQIFYLHYFTFHKTEIFCDKIFSQLRLFYTWLFWLFFKTKMAIFSIFNLATLLLDARLTLLHL